MSATCLYCDATIADETIVPDINDDEGWDELSMLHAAGCEWIDTRAHRLVDTMTLWDAYRLANRRGAALSVTLADEAGLGNGRTEKSLRVSRNLVGGEMVGRRTVGGSVAVQQGTTADWIFVPEERARQIIVARS